MQMAKAIVTDAKFEVRTSACSLSCAGNPDSSWRVLQNNLDYMDDNAERFGRKKIKSDAAKRTFAVGGAVTVPKRHGQKSDQLTSGLLCRLCQDQESAG
jgi:hypothetical protein